MPVPTPMIHCTLAITLGTALALAQPASNAPAPESAPAAPAQPAQATPEVFEPGYRLIDPGAEPRRIVQLKFVPGGRETGDGVIHLNIDAMTDGKPVTAAVPSSIAVHLQCSNIRVNPDGIGEYKLLIDEIDAIPAKGVSPKLAEPFRQAVKTAAGCSLILAVAPNGRIVGRESVTPITIHPMMKDSIRRIQDVIQQQIPALPEEPVGVGARWRVILPDSTYGPVLERTMDCTLLELTPESAKVQIVSNYLGRPQKIAAEGAGERSELILDAVAGDSTNTMTVQGTGVLPTSYAHEGKSAWMMRLGEPQKDGRTKVRPLYQKIIQGGSFTSEDSPPEAPASTPARDTAPGAK